MLSIFVTINDVEYKFKMDTGYNGSFSIPYKKDLNFLDETHQSFEGNLYRTLSGTTKNTTDYFFNDKTIAFQSTQYKTTITVSQSIKAQNVGMGFIKGFNWIIDAKNKKLYVKKNQHEIDTKSSYSKKYIIVAENHNIKIMAKTLWKPNTM